MEKKIIYRYNSLRGTNDDDYIFYDDGTIEHEYDRNNFKFNLKETIEPKNIKSSKKQEIINNCPEGLKDQIQKILEI